MGLLICMTSRLFRERQDLPHLINDEPIQLFLLIDLTEQTDEISSAQFFGSNWMMHV
jgi:hypothetical protein